MRVDGDRHDAHAHAMASPGRLTEVKADPLLTWLERLLGERAPIGIESCLDGRLFARALRELAGEGAHPASTGDALEDLRAGLDRAGLGERCAYMLAALDARDVSGARSLLSVIYAHYAAHHARRYADDAAGPRREPEPSASSPTRSERQDERQGERRAAAARALMQGPPLDEGVYVSEPHFLPPRMDVDDNRDHPNAPPAAASVSGFVPSAAETRAAALARERAAAATRGDEDGGGGGAVFPESARTLSAARDEELRPRDDDETALVASSFGAGSRDDGDDVLRASIASLAASMDAGVLQSERDAELMAALMAEARLDAEAENHGHAPSPPTNREEDHLSDENQDDEHDTPPEPEGAYEPDSEADERAYRAATAAARAELAARVSVDIASSAGGSLRSSWDRGWGSPGRAPGPGPGFVESPSAAAEARREILERLGGIPLENPLDAAADEAAELRESVAALRASLDLDGGDSRAGSSTNASLDRGSLRSSLRGSVIGAGRARTRISRLPAPRRVASLPAPRRVASLPARVSFGSDASRRVRSAEGESSAAERSPVVDGDARSHDARRASAPHGEGYRGGGEQSGGATPRRGTSRADAFLRGGARGEGGRGTRPTRRRGEGAVHGDPNAATTEKRAERRRGSFGGFRRGAFGGIRDEA